MAVAHETHRHPDVVTLAGQQAEGEPGATPMPWLASRITAAVSSCTGTQMLMPSEPPTSTP